MLKSELGKYFTMHVNVVVFCCNHTSRRNYQCEFCCIQANLRHPRWNGQLQPQLPRFSACSASVNLRNSMLRQRSQQSAFLDGALSIWNLQRVLRRLGFAEAWKFWSVVSYVSWWYAFSRVVDIWTKKRRHPYGLRFDNWGIHIIALIILLQSSCHSIQSVLSEWNVCTGNQMLQWQLQTARAYMCGATVHQKSSMKDWRTT